jgi:inner membrane protein
MATIFSHVLIPITLRVGFGRERISNRLLALGCLGAILPDGDVIAFKLGIAYEDAFGHRGASHSISFALLMGVLAMLFSKQLHASKISAFLVMFISTLSHACLDAMTSGGHGVALLWPYDDTRYFFPWRPIKVSPIGSAFFTERGMQTVISEAKTILLWCVVSGTLMFGIRRVFSTKER